jgi:hypothetical protein
MNQQTVALLHARLEQLGCRALGLFETNNRSDLIVMAERPGHHHEFVVWYYFQGHLHHGFYTDDEVDALGEYLKRVENSIRVRRENRLREERAKKVTVMKPQTLNEWINTTLKEA